MNRKEIGTRTSAKASVPASKAARQAFHEGLSAKAADFELPALEGEVSRGKGRSKGKGSKGEGKGKKEMTAATSLKKMKFQEAPTLISTIWL